MNRTITFILTMVLINTLFAQTNLTNVSRIKATYDLGDEGDTTSYTEYFYDKTGRCTKVIMHNSYFGYVETIDYPNATSVVSTLTYTRDNKTRTTTYKLNNKGQAVSFTEIEDGDTVSDRFLYNAAGFAIMLGSVGWRNATDELLKEGDFNINTAVIVDKGNITQDGSGTMFTFYPEKQNTIGNKNIGIGYLGNDNKNLVKEKSEPVMDTYIKTTFTYLYDAKGRVVKKTESTSYSNFVTTYLYVN